MNFNKIPPEIQVCIFKDYYGQRCISKKLNNYNHHYYLDYFDNTPISKNEVYRYFQGQPNYMITFNGNSFCVYEYMNKNYLVYLNELIIEKTYDLYNVLIQTNVLIHDILHHEYQHLDLSTTFHILSKRLDDKKRITDYVLKLYNEYVYDIKIKNIDDYLLLQKMIQYTDLNIEMLSCDQSIDYDLDLGDVVFCEGKVDDENREDIENHQQYHLKSRELLVYKINHFLY